MVNPTKIDRLTTVYETQEFVKSIDSSMINFLYVSPKKYKRDLYVNSKILNELDSMFINYKLLLKEDFDANGYTDLIVTGEKYRHSFDVFAIMNQGNETYRVEYLTISGINDFPVYPKLVYKENLPVIELYGHARMFDDTMGNISKRTLTYNVNQQAFLEYNAKPLQKEVAKIEFSRSGCFGKCPVFDLILYKDKPSTLKAKAYNFSKTYEFGKEEGIFETMIDEDNFAKISQLINYINSSTLKSTYFAAGTCQETLDLKITFADGTIKAINDYGGMGTNGLVLLYNKLSRLRFNQDWKKL
ncbi:DUF6438 domain-containing protein [Kordia sp.]|uniref:DUF6438 domain-containing protein n=1 Tax=Kordia sp. TaxID=1965332 RepID=UPI003B5BC99B